MRTRIGFALALPLLLTACGAPVRIEPWDCGCGDTGSDWHLDDLFGRPLPIPAGVDGSMDVDIADPHVIVVDGTYHLYATAPGHDFRVWTSTDLCEWSEGQVVWEPPAPWDSLAVLWAPSVHPGDGGYYLYYTVGLRIGVAFADSPLGPFEEVVDTPLIGGGLAEVAIDAFLFEASDGSKWLYSTYNPEDALVVTPMADHTTVAGDPIPLLTPGDDSAWEGSIVEAPWVVEHDGRFHLMYSGNETWTQHYAVGVAVADSPAGPFVRYADNPILGSDEELGLWGPGHHALVQGPDGSTLIFHHAKIGPGAGFNRRIFVGRVDFDAGGEIVVE